MYLSLSNSTYMLRIRKKKKNDSAILTYFNGKIYWDFKETKNCTEVTCLVCDTEGTSIQSITACVQWYKPIDNIAWQGWSTLYNWSRFKQN